MSARRSDEVIEALAAPCRSELARACRSTGGRSGKPGTGDRVGFDT